MLFQVHGVIFVYVLCVCVCVVVWSWIFISRFITRYECLLFLYHYRISC